MQKYSDIALDTLSGENNHVSISPSGRYIFIFQEPVEGVQQAYIFTAKGLQIQHWKEHHRPGHGDMTLDANGDDVYVGVSKSAPDKYRIIKRRLKDGQVTTLAPYGDGNHVSARNTQLPGWVFVSYSGQYSDYLKGDSDGPVSNGRAPFYREVVAIRIDGSGEIRRIAQTRNADHNYWSETHASPSPDGSQVIWSSNWGRAGRSCRRLCFAHCVAGRIKSRKQETRCPAINRRLPMIRFSKQTEQPDRNKRNTTGQQLVYWLGCLLVTVAILWPSGQQAKAEYLLGPGDKLDISVLGIKELQQQILVQPDGTISFPLLGTLAVSGQSLPDVRSMIKAILASKIYRQKTSGGSEQAIVIGVDEITVVVAEYRPIYVKGGVARAGEYTFRPSMTVREAIALSGGYDILPVKSNNPYLDTADFRGEYESLWLAFAKQQARVWRLKTELEDQNADQEATPKNVPIDAPISREMIDEISELATTQLESRRANIHRQETFLKQSIEQMEMRIATVMEREEQEKQGAKAEADALERIIALYDNRTLVHAKVIDARRNVLLSVSRKLETSAELMQLRQQKIDLVEQLNKLADEQRIALLKELEEATLELGELRTKLQTVGDKLRYTATSKAQVVEGSTREPLITVHRRKDGQWQQQAVSESFELAPGDVVEVSVSE